MPRGNAGNAGGGGAVSFLADKKTKTKGDWNGRVLYWCGGIKGACGGEKIFQNLKNHEKLLLNIHLRRNVQKGITYFRLILVLFFKKIVI